jgi:hypothetical protein
MSLNIYMCQDWGCGRAEYIDCDNSSCVAMYPSAQKMAVTRSFETCKSKHRHSPEDNIHPHTSHEF